MGLTILHRADFLLTMASNAVIRGGEVLVDAAGKIISVGAQGSVAAYDTVQRHQILMPGVINGHVHLTDSGIEAPVPGGEGLTSWVRELLATRSAAKVGGGDIQEKIIVQMHAAGTVAIGEVCNGYSTLPAVAGAGIFCRYINELIGFRPLRAPAIIGAALEEEDSRSFPPSIRPTLGAHAPYSVSPELLTAIIGANKSRSRFTYEHLAEDPAERKLYDDGSGEWKYYLEQVGAWEPAWNAPAKSPIEYYLECGFLDREFVGVHLSDASAEEVRMYAASGARLILSPSSNKHIHGRMPLFPEVVASNITFGLGTDGRGSNASVDVFDEARMLAETFPDSSNGALLKALTIDGARILQFHDLLGSIERGKQPGLVSVEAGIRGESLADLEEAILLHARSRKRVM